MADRLKIIASILLIIVSMGFIIYGNNFSSTEIRESTTKVPGGYNVFEKLIPAEYSDNKYHAIFVVSPTTCPPCIFEISEYMQVLDSLKISHSMILKTNDSKKSQKFIKLVQYDTHIDKVVNKTYKNISSVV